MGAGDRAGASPALCSLFFFFQAEDGIRDHCVTGVQTCALPICNRRPAASRVTAKSSTPPVMSDCQFGEMAKRLRALPISAMRSEERRVGKECRSRWGPDYENDEAGSGKRVLQRVCRRAARLWALGTVRAHHRLCVRCFFFFKQKTAYEITV